jgi:hypothetical protein
MVDFKIPLKPSIVDVRPLSSPKGSPDDQITRRPVAGASQATVLSCPSRMRIPSDQGHAFARKNRATNVTLKTI